jgi:hypothetical protein
MTPAGAGQAQSERPWISARKDLALTADSLLKQLTGPMERVTRGDWNNRSAYEILVQKEKIKVRVTELQLVARVSHDLLRKLLPSLIQCVVGPASMSGYIWIERPERGDTIVIVPSGIQDAAARSVSITRSENTSQSPG